VSIHVAESIDRVMSIEIRYGAGSQPRGFKIPLYTAARERQGGQPLVWLAARKLHELLQRRDVVMIVTGAGGPLTLPKGETDGPMGAASLGRVLDYGIGARTVYVSDPPFVEPIKASVEACGVSMLDNTCFEKRPHSALMETFPVGALPARVAATDLLDRYRPKAVIFIEKVGPTAKGTFHSVTGTVKDPAHVAHCHVLCDLARERRIFTLGVGDGGNEIGNGVIMDAVRRLHPHGETIATVTATDLFVFASVSNWGAYGVAAYLAHELKNVDLFQNEEMEDFMLRRCVAAGAMDGGHGAQILWVDGVPSATNRAIVTLMRDIVDHGLKSHSRFF
jgi:D-glutamate cyclase